MKRDSAPRGVPAQSHRNFEFIAQLANDMGDGIGNARQGRSASQHGVEHASAVIRDDDAFDPEEGGYPLAMRHWFNPMHRRAGIQDHVARAELSTWLLK